MSELLFSVNRLAQLLERDRATITRAVANIPPDGRDKQGNLKWKISSVVEVMSKQSGSSGSNPRMLTLADRLEQSGDEVLAALEKLRAIPDIAKRRKLAEGGLCQCIGKLSAALEACEQSLKPAERGMWAIAADVALGEAIREAVQLCEFKIRPEKEPA